MRLRGSVVLATIMLFAALPALGVTIPHNEALYKGDDARLDSRITYHADGYPVSRVLADISNATGVVMQAGIDDQDWMVYDRKVIVHVKEMKLQTLMEELSSVLHFHWSRGGEEGKWTYRLWQDKL